MRDMRTIDLDSWEQFPNEIAKIRNEFGTHVPEGSDPLCGSDIDILFRGQSNSKWGLQTTLERDTGGGPYSIVDYVQRAASVANEIESLTGKNWNLPSYLELSKEIKSGNMTLSLPCYEYLVYLRHHGFSSPLLDWTQSPQIAAYFALEQSASDVERCSVFAFIECPENSKIQRQGDISIQTMGPYITTHPRHFSQKANYTIAMKWERENNDYYFCSHDDVSPALAGTQDVLFKITIPRSDRIAALKQLDENKINHDTLFQPEDLLIHTLSLRVFDFIGR